MANAGRNDKFIKLSVLLHNSQENSSLVGSACTTLVRNGSQTRAEFLRDVTLEIGIDLIITAVNCSQMM